MKIVFKVDTCVHSLDNITIYTEYSVIAWYWMSVYRECFSTPWMQTLKDNIKHDLKKASLKRETNTNK